MGWELRARRRPRSGRSIRPGADRGQGRGREGAGAGAVEELGELARGHGTRVHPPTRPLGGRGRPSVGGGITEKAEAMRRELLGANPSLLDQLLTRRVVNGWVAVYALELELTVRTPTDARTRGFLDRALSRAQKRRTDAARELARTVIFNFPLS